MRYKSLTSLAFLCVSALAVVSCSSPQNYAKAVNSWEGAPAHALVQQWGHPAEVETLRNGNKQYFYHSVEEETLPKGYAPTLTSRLSPQNLNALSRPSDVVRGNRYTFVCDTTFEVNPQGRIIKTSFQGNNCVATSGIAQRRSF